VAVGGEPRGGVIKVAIGLVILAFVLAWALRRRARGAKPSLPGAPRT
jgi:MYXO-CTERM domain-containing protein